MKRILPAGILLTTVCCFMCMPSNLTHTSPETILIASDHLSIVKNSLGNGEAKFKKAFDALLVEADEALVEGPFSVTHKEKLPPSGDKNDYASYSRYWWPDPEKSDGLPYVRHDGKTNPNSQNPKTSDRQRIGSFAENVETLGLAYYFTGEEKYAVKAAELLKVWFLDEETRMNPNVNHAQCRLGHNEGSKSGILDGRLLVGALEGSLLIASSEAWSESENDRLQAWSKQYFEWLTTNEMALEESESKNNHGTYYDAQALYFAIYSGNLEAATDIAENFSERRLLSQINPDGTMPEELARTRPLFYSIYNLQAMFLVAALAEKVGVDVWEVDEEDARLRAGLDYIAPYADVENNWPHPTIKEADRMEMFGVLNLGDRKYPDGNYDKYAESLPSEKRYVHRANLAFPLMR